MELGLRGNKAVVTGASRGLGRAIALELAREGCDLAVCARGEADLAEAARELGEVGGGTVHAEPIDVARDLANSGRTLMESDWSKYDAILAQHRW